MNRLVGRLLCLGIIGGLNLYGRTISIDPATAVVAIGSSVSVNVNVSGLSDLYAFQFDLSFDPTVLSAVSITEGSLFSSVGVFFSPGLIDNVGGSITFIGDSLSGPGPGLSTDGTLAQIAFSAIGIGTTTIHLSNIFFLNSTLDDISASSSDGTLTVRGTSTTPEPRTGMLLGIALSAIGLTRAKRRSLDRSPSV